MAKISSKMSSSCFCSTHTQTVILFIVSAIAGAIAILLVAWADGPLFIRTSRDIGLLILLGIILGPVLAVPVGIWIRRSTSEQVCKELSGCGTFVAGLLGAIVLLAVSSRLPGLSLWRNLLEDQEEFTTRRTNELLGIQVQPYPPPQGSEGFDELEVGANPTLFHVADTEHSDHQLQHFLARSSVSAAAADGTAYEAFTQLAAMGDIESVRHLTFDMHHHAATDLRIATLQTAQRLLFFPDVGSHTYSPHYLILDGKGSCHLIVADVSDYYHRRTNRFDFLHLKLYWLRGDLQAQTWLDGWLIDDRRYTQNTKPWAARDGDLIHLLWNFGGLDVNKPTPASGLYYTNRSGAKFGRKTRIGQGLIDAYAAAVDAGTHILAVVSVALQGYS